MRIEEARRIRELIYDLKLPPRATILNIGSSTGYFREIVQPHIDGELIRPLINIGYQVIHSDIKADEGVDVVGDVLLPEFRNSLKIHRADLVLCCNIMEHLTNAADFAKACEQLIRPGGYLIVTVPYSYPYHKDPIDSGMRPTPSEISALFPGLDLRVGEIVVSTTYLDDSLRSKGGAKIMFASFVKTFLPFYNSSGWRSRAHRFLWLFRPYKVSLALFQRRHVAVD